LVDDYDLPLGYAGLVASFFPTLLRIEFVLETLAIILNFSLFPDGYFLSLRTSEYEYFYATDAFTYKSNYY